MLISYDFGLDNSAGSFDFLSYSNPHMKKRYLSLLSFFLYLASDENNPLINQMRSSLITFLTSSRHSAHDIMTDSYDLLLAIMQLLFSQIINNWSFSTQFLLIIS